ncbi:hypothetical protein NC652_017574 [Populus alba x Populus x berolinensis]|nr:hypothetical protein NC652_017574 [Populus alba x Populus x berolinensis]
MRQLIIKKGKELGDLPPKLKQNGLNAWLTLMQTYSCSVKLNEEDYCRNRRSADFKDVRMMYVLGNFEGWESAKLEKLRKALSTKADASNSESGVADNEDLSDWGTIWLTFAPERGKDGMSRKEDSNDYVVHDPLLEKGKEKFNQMRAKQKRREREWAGKPLA